MITAKRSKEAARISAAFVTFVANSHTVRPKDSVFAGCGLSRAGNKQRVILIPASQRQAPGWNGFKRFARPCTAFFNAQA